MPVLFSPDGSLVSTTNAIAAKGYKPITIGSPMSVELRNFFPGPSIKEWNNKTELMVSSQVRVGPESTPPPQRVNIMVLGYPFKHPEPILGVAGDSYGDMMLHYTKSYTGGRLGMTVRAIELDKIAAKRFKDITSAMKSIGSLAMFSSAAPYFGAAALAMRTINALIRAFSRNDPVIHVPIDLRFQPASGGVLQAGRYLFWKKPPNWQTFVYQCRLDKNNVLIKDSDGSAYSDHPYLVVEIDGRKRPPYDNFEIGAKSAELLEEWGDKDAASTALNTIMELAMQVNDAKQLRSVAGLTEELSTAVLDQEKAEIKKKIEAHTKLFTKDNSDLLSELLKPVLG